MKHFPMSVAILTIALLTLGCDGRGSIKVVQMAETAAPSLQASPFILTSTLPSPTDTATAAPTIHVFDYQTSKIAYISDRTGASYSIYSFDMASAEDILISPIGYEPVYTPSWSPDGDRIAYAVSSPSTQILTINFDGTENMYLTNGVNPDWSPDGARIAFSDGRRISVIDVETGQITHLTPQSADFVDWQPKWSPDGSKLSFIRMKLTINGQQTSFSEPRLWVIQADGTNAMRLASVDVNIVFADWSADGLLTYQDREGRCLFSVDSESQEIQEAFCSSLIGDFPILGFSWSPDGVYLTCSSKRDGDYEIYTVNLVTGEEIQITNNMYEDSWPDWQP